jgi:hypothetical protein
MSPRCAILTSSELSITHGETLLLRLSALLFAELGSTYAKGQCSQQTHHEQERGQL